jgi:hypothetical protein
MNRRAMGMEDCQAATFFKKETKVKKNRWEGLVQNKKSGPQLASVQAPSSTNRLAGRPGLISRQCSDSMLLRPRRQPSSPNSPKPLAVQDPASTTKPARRPGLVSRQCSDSMLQRPRRQPSSPNSPKPLADQDLASTTKPARRPGLGTREYSDSMILRPRRQVPSPSSPMQLLTIEQSLAGRIENQNMHRWASSSVSCLDETVPTTQANGTADTKAMTREDRRTLSRRLLDSMLSPKKEETTKPPGSPGLGSRQYSDSMLLRPRRQPSSPNSPMQLQTIEQGLAARIENRNIHPWASSSMSCVNEEVQSRVTRNLHSGKRPPRRAQEVRRESPSEQIRGKMSDSILISGDAAVLKTPRQQDPTTTLLGIVLALVA